MKLQDSRGKVVRSKESVPQERDRETTEMTTITKEDLETMMVMKVATREEGMMNDFFKK